MQYSTSLFGLVLEIAYRVGRIAFRPLYSFLVFSICNLKCLKPRTHFNLFFIFSPTYERSGTSNNHQHVILCCPKSVPTAFSETRTGTEVYINQISYVTCHDEPYANANWVGSRFLHNDTCVQHTWCFSYIHACTPTQVQRNLTVLSSQMRPHVSVLALFHHSKL
jgi:hypothetical protein